MFAVGTWDVNFGASAEIQEYFRSFFVQMETLKFASEIY